MHRPQRALRRSLAPLGLVLVSACGPSQPGRLSAPGVRAVVDTAYYEVEGSTRGQWAASMRVAARRAGVPAPFLAHTTWQSRWSYASSRSTPLGCEARQPSVELVVHFTMPRLVPDSAVAPEDMLEWRRHLASLWQHEEGHRIRAFRAAAEMRDSLASLHTSSCAELQPALTRSTNAVVAKYRVLEDAYDARSGHGARQGAMLIPAATARVTIDTTFRDTLP